MAEMLKQQHHLMALRLSLDRSSAPPSSIGFVVFTLEISGKTVFTAQVDYMNIGVPADLHMAREYHYNEPSYVIPASVIQGLQEKIRERLAPDLPLWLQFTSDSGLLTMVPWERLLLPHLNVPLFRLPPFAVKPFSPPSSSFDIILCASTSSVKTAILVARLLDKLTERFSKKMQQGALTIHVFADAQVYSALQQKFHDRITSLNVSGLHLYNPAHAPTPLSSASSIQDTSGYLESPWLLWMIDALKGRSINAVHFLCHAYLSSDQGALAFTEAPALNKGCEWARFVSAQQLMTFLTHLGVSAIGFSSPADNYSVLGLRVFVDQLAHLYVGDILLHEVVEDASFQSVADAYNFLFGDEQERLPTLTFYTHPDRVQQILPQTGDLDQEGLLNQYTLATGETGKILASEANTPPWIASSQRRLEQSVAELINAGPSDIASPNPVQQGLGEALAFLSEKLRLHASLTNQQQEEEGS